MSYDLLLPLPGVLRISIWVIFIAYTEILILFSSASGQELDVDLNLAEDWVKTFDMGHEG